MTTFEQPLSERLRTFIRLQQLSNRINHYSSQSSEWDIHTSVLLLLDLYEITSRVDLKSEVMKELERQSQSLSQFLGSSQIDSQQLSVILSKQRDLIARLHEQQGQITQHIKSSEFLNSVRQRCTASGSACSYDLPVYYHWLNRSRSECKAAIMAWLQPFDAALQAINLALETIRESTGFKVAVATEGFFQQALGNSTRPPQLIRVRTGGNIFPEISGSKHLMTVRFFEYVSVNDRTVQATDDVSFQFSLCTI